MIVSTVRARRGDAHRVADLVVAALHGLEVAAWLVPDRQERERVLYAHTRILVDHAMDHGTIILTDDHAGVAVWLPRARPLPPVVDYDRRLWLACGRHADRFRVLDAAVETHHPTEVNHQLALLAVHPDHRGRGLGGLLLHRYHTGLDRTSTAAYVEASSPDSRALFQGHGYLDLGHPIDLPDHGPRLWPMWRTPQPVPPVR